MNPHSAEELSDAILLALKMPHQERLRRWRAMMDIVESEDVYWWRKRVMNARLTVPEASREPELQY